MAILFKEDWGFYDAFPNTETANESFIRLASLYKDMGISNYSFILALHDKSLVGVDPHDPNLDPLTIGKIGIEAKINPWFYLRECVKAPPITGIENIPFEAHRGNISLWWLFMNHITNILVQIRQTGKSFATDCLGVYLMNIRCDNTQINLLTKDDTLRKENMDRIKRIEDNLPYYFKQRTNKDINNTEMFSIVARNNRYIGHVPQKSPKDALKVGRGLTSPIFFIDEAPFQPNIGIALPAALTAGTRARENAELAGEPYGTIITTTAGKKDDVDGKYVYDMCMQSAPWSEKFLDARNRQELEEMVRKHSSKGVPRVYSCFNHRQLGKDDIWLKKTIEGAENITPEDADRDFFNIWTAGSLHSPLPVSLLEKIRKAGREQVCETTSKIGGYITRWYIPESSIPVTMGNDRFILAMDSSDAQGGDDISLVLMSVTSGEVIAAGTYNETNLITFAEFVAQWLIDYPNILLIPERRSSGVAIIDVLLRMLPARGIDPFRRIFNRVVNDAEEDRNRFEEINVPMGRRDSYVYVDHKKHFGFATSGSGITSRTELYSTTLQAAAKRLGEKINDIKIIDQLTSLIIINGRVDHPKGGHDDMVIGWLLCCWLVLQGKNLGFYGIDYRQILAKLQLNNGEKKDDYQEYEQMKIREMMDEVYNKLKGEKDDFLANNLEFKLRHLNSKLIRKENEIFVIDDLINSIKENKKKNRIVGNTDREHQKRLDAVKQSGFSYEPLKQVSNNVRWSVGRY